MEDFEDDWIFHRPNHDPHNHKHVMMPITSIVASDYATSVALSVFPTLFDRKDAPEFVWGGKGI